MLGEDLQHSLDALTEDSNKRQDKHGVFLRPHFQLALHGQLGVLLLQNLGNLDTPLILELADTEQSSAHDSNDHTGEDAEDTLPDVLCSLKGVAACRIEGTNHTSTDDEADDNACSNAVPDLGESVRIGIEFTTAAYLANQSLVNGSIVLRTERLLQEGEQDGDDDASLQTFSEADEEHFARVSM